MMSTMTSRQADKYKLNYVEVEIGPPKLRESGEKVPLIKVSNGNSNRVNYSTIVFPSKSSSSTANNDNRHMPAASPNTAGSRSVPTAPTAPTFTFASKDCVHPTPRVSTLAPGMAAGTATAVGSCRKRTGLGVHAKLERKGSQLTEAQLQQQQQLDVPKTPPNSPPRRRALSTPTRTRKFPSESEITESMKSEQEWEPTPPKTRTLPPREKPWNPDAVEQDSRDDSMSVEPVAIGTKTDLHKCQIVSHSSAMLSNSAPSGSELSYALQALRMKTRRKSSSGDAYEVVNDPSEMARIAGSFHQEPLSASSSRGGPEASPFSSEVANILKCSPVMKRHRTELEKAFARRKLTGRISGEPDGYISHSGSQSSSGNSSPQEGFPTQFADVSSMSAKFIPVLPVIKSGSRDNRGFPETSKTLVEHRYTDSAQQQTRKPIPAPRFGQQSRESSSESLNDPVYLNQRPVLSLLTQQQQQQQQHQQPLQTSAVSSEVTASTQQGSDDTYMNIAFSKPKQDSHRYENVILDDRSVSLDRCSNASDSPRDSLEIHSSRPIPAPRLHGGSNNTMQGSPLASSPDHGNQHHHGNQQFYDNHHHLHNNQQFQGCQYLQSSQYHQGSQIPQGIQQFLNNQHHHGNKHHQGNQHKASGSQHQQGKQYGHTRQGSYGSTAVILGHINSSATPSTPSHPAGSSKPNKQTTAQLNDSTDALYATPCKQGHVTPSGLGGNHHGRAPKKGTHGIVPEVPLSPKPEVPTHGTSRRDSQSSTSSLGGNGKVSDGEKSMSIGKALSHLIKDGEKRERKHRERAHGEKKSREERKASGEKKNHHGDREKRGHGKRHHRGDTSHGSAGSNKTKLERPSYGTQPWYYGRMLRQECEYLMLSQGQSCQYLVRDSSHRTGDLMLSVLYGSKVHHYVIQTTANHKFHIAHHDFNMVEDILDFYHHHVIMYSPEKEPVYLTQPFILKHK